MAPDIEPSDQPDDKAPDSPTVPNVPVAPVAPTTPVPVWTPNAGDPAPAPGVQGPAPGWYPDPWLGGHYRFWNGTHWTGDSYRGPDPTARPGPGSYAPYLSSADSGLTPAASPWDAPPAHPAPPGASQWDAPPAAIPPASSWDAPPAPPAGPGASSWDAPPAPPAPAGPPSDRPRMSRGRFAVVLALVAVVVGSGSFAGAYLYHSRNETTSAASSPNPLAPSSPSTTAPPTDPSSSALSRIVVAQDDVGSSLTVATINQGQSLGQPTLDLCNGNYPSETSRTARLQVAGADDQGNTALSTEAVLYRNASGSLQAFNELRSAATNCPSTPVQSPVGEPTVATKFNAAPDGSWPQQAGVERLAYDFTTTDGTGQTNHSVAVYLRRGRALLGIYFQQPDSPPSVAGQSTLSGIVNVLASRLAQLPASSISA